MVERIFNVVATGTERIGHQAKERGGSARKERLWVAPDPVCQLPSSF